MGNKIISQNRKARHFYSVFDTFEAGIVLEGFEVKSVKAGEVNLKDGYVRIENEEAFLHNIHISPYRYLSHLEYNPLRKRKLLLTKHEIKKLMGRMQAKGFGLVPLDIYINKKGFIKLTIAVVKGKKLFDKREDKKRKELVRELKKEYKGRHSI